MGKVIRPDGPEYVDGHGPLEVLGITRCEMFAVNFTDDQQRKRTGIFIAFGAGQDGGLNLVWWLDDEQMTETFGTPPTALLPKIRAMVEERYGVTAETLAYGNSSSPSTVASNVSENVAKVLGSLGDGYDATEG